VERDWGSQHHADSQCVRMATASVHL